MAGSESLHPPAWGGVSGNSSPVEDVAATKSHNSVSTHDDVSSMLDDDIVGAGGYTTQSSYGSCSTGNGAILPLYDQVAAAQCVPADTAIGTCRDCRLAIHRRISLCREVECLAYPLASQVGMACRTPTAAEREENVKRNWIELQSKLISFKLAEQVVQEDGDKLFYELLNVEFQPIKLSREREEKLDRELEEQLFRQFSFGPRAGFRLEISSMLAQAFHPRPLKRSTTAAVDTLIQTGDMESGNDSLKLQPSRFQKNSNLTCVEASRYYNTVNSAILTLPFQGVLAQFGPELLLLPQTAHYGATTVPPQDTRDVNAYRLFPPPHERKRDEKLASERMKKLVEQRCGGGRNFKPLGGFRRVNSVRAAHGHVLQTRSTTTEVVDTLIRTGDMEAGNLHIAGNPIGVGGSQKTPWTDDYQFSIVIEVPRNDNNPSDDVNHHQPPSEIIISDSDSVPGHDASLNYYKMLFAASQILGIGSETMYDGTRIKAYLYITIASLAAAMCAVRLLARKEGSKGFRQEQYAVYFTGFSFLLVEVLHHSSLDQGHNLTLLKTVIRVIDLVINWWVVGDLLSYGNAFRMGLPFLRRT